MHDFFRSGRNLLYGCTVQVIIVIIIIINIIIICSVIVIIPLIIISGQSKDLHLDPVEVDLAFAALLPGRYYHHII